MDPTEQGCAASSKPYSDLDARLLAMRLGDASSSRQQAMHPAPNPQESASTATPAARPLPQLPPYASQEFVPTVKFHERAPPENPPKPQESASTATPAARPPPQLPPYPSQEFVPTAKFHERAPPEKPPKPQELVPTNSLDERLLLQQAQQHALELKRKWLQSQPHLLGYGGGEGSAGAGSVSPVGASSIFSRHTPRFNTSAAPFMPKVPMPSRMSASAEYFQPVPKSSMMSASGEAFLPIPRPHPSMSQSSWTPSPNAGQYLPQLGAAAASSVPHGNASLDPYASTLLTAGHAHNQEWWGHVPAIDRPPWLDEVQALSLYAQRNPAILTPAWAAHRLVHLLADGGEVVRLRVLEAVKSAANKYMGCREQYVVFLAVLRACEGRFEELHGIVTAACTGGGSLVLVATEVHGETALKELIRVVAPYPKLSQSLISHLLRERLMEHEKGAHLLCHCFTTLPYKDCLIIIHHAIASSSEMVSSVNGTKCLIECFEHARNEELRAIELFILSNTYALAQGVYSNYFLQLVLECGSKQLQEGIAERVAHSINTLSDLPGGSYVVVACIHLTCSLVPLLRVLNAFLDLHEDQLAQLVQGSNSNYVVQTLLEASKPHFSEQTLALAKRILKLPLADPRSVQAMQVLTVARKLLSQEGPVGQ